MTQSNLYRKYSVVETNRQFNPSRIELARKRRGLSKTALALNADVRRERIHRFLNGTENPSWEELQSIAVVLRFPISFFYRDEIDEPDNATFRSMSTMTAAERNSALAAGALCGELSQWIDERYKLPDPDTPDLRDHPPAQAAAALRSWWGIGERPIGNMVHLLESKGVRVFSLVKGCRRVDAFSLWLRNVPFVFLNTIKTGEHGRTDSAHELGHLTMHRHGVQKGRGIEKEAQQFAGAFLVPEGSVRANVGKLHAPTMSDLVRMKRRWKVSVSLLAYRLHELGLISDYYYRRICIEISRYGRKREPEGVKRETSHVLAFVFDDLRKRGKRKGDVAAELGLSTEEIDSLIFGLGGLTAITGGGRKYDPEAEAHQRNIKPV